MFVEDEIIEGTDTVRGQLIEYFDTKRQTAVAYIDKFRNDMAKDPLRTMEWADTTFEAVAVREVSDMIVYMLKHYTDLDDVVKSMESSVREKARYINNKSTSVSSNLMKECMLAQVTQALSHLELFI